MDLPAAPFRRASDRGPGDPADKERVLRGAVTGDRLHEAGDVLIGRGEHAPHAFLVTEGWAGREVTLTDGRVQIVNFLLPGDLFGLRGAAGLPSDHTVRALTPLRVASLASVGIGTGGGGTSDGNGAGNGSGAGASASLSALFGDAVLKEQAILREQVTRNGRRSARERVAHLLLELYERSSAAGLAERDAFALPIGQAAIADALGLSYVHVSRVLGALEKSGLIARRRGEVAFGDRAALEAMCDFSSLYLRSRDVHSSPVKD